jgi:hypothetical protein
MFDDLKCHYPLPVDGANGFDYQTKDLLCFMDKYEIREDGTLWHEAYDVEDQSDPDAEGFMALCGLMARVNKRWEQVNHTGEVRFYDWLEPDGWIEWSAYFVAGQIREINLVEHTPDIGDGMPVYHIEVPPSSDAVDPIASSTGKPSTRVENS